MTSFATELVTPSVTDVRYVRTPYRLYKDSYSHCKSWESCIKI